MTSLINKQVDLFDHYWDHYRYDFMTFKQTEAPEIPRHGTTLPQITRKRKNDD